MICLRMEYAPIVWLSHTKKDIRKIKSTQRATTKKGKEEI